MSESIGQIHARLAGAQKGHARGAPAYSVYVNRRIGRWLAAAGYAWGWSPNRATVVSALHTAAALIVIALAPISWWTGVLIAALLVLGYAWDSADGQIARLSGGGSLAGEWLDHIVDAAKIASLHLCVLIGLARHTELDASWMLLPLAFSAAAVVNFFGMLLNDLLKGKSGAESTHARGGGTLQRSLLLLPTDFGMVCVVFVLWGWTGAFLLGYGLLAATAISFLALALVRWYREMVALDTSRER